MMDYQRFMELVERNPKFLCFQENGAHLIPVWSLETPDDGTNVLAQLDAGWRFKPHSHPYPVTIHILSGAGTFELRGARARYRAGDEIEVGAHALHAFALVAEETLFIKHAQITWPLSS